MSKPVVPATRIIAAVFLVVLAAWFYCLGGFDWDFVQIPVYSFWLALYPIRWWFGGTTVAVVPRSKSPFSALMGLAAFGCGVIMDVVFYIMLIVAVFSAVSLIATGRWPS